MTDKLILQKTIDRESKEFTKTKRQLFENLIDELNPKNVFEIMDIKNIATARAEIKKLEPLFHRAVNDDNANMARELRMKISACEESIQTAIKALKGNNPYYVSKKETAVSEAERTADTTHFGSLIRK